MGVYTQLFKYNDICNFEIWAIDLANCTIVMNVLFILVIFSDFLEKKHSKFQIQISKTTDSKYP